MSWSMSVDAMATPLVEMYPNVCDNIVKASGLSLGSNDSVHRMLRNGLSTGSTFMRLKNLLISVLKANVLSFQFRSILIKLY